MESRVEKILEVATGVEGATIPKPQSRMEEFLVAMLTDEKETNLPTPRSRVETLLKQAADSGVEEYDGTVEVTEDVD